MCDIFTICTTVCKKNVKQKTKHGIKKYVDDKQKRDFVQIKFTKKYKK